MNKILCTLLFLLLSKGVLHAIIITPFIEQTQYRWRNNDGNQATATWMAPVNTSVAAADTTTLLRLRMEFRNNSGATATINETLEYSSNGGTNWTAITNTATNAFRYEPSTLVANATATTNQMGAATPGTFVAGRVVSAPGAALNIVNNRRTEYEWIIRPTSNVQPFTTYIFRTSNQGSTPINYGQLSIGCVGTLASGNVIAGATFVDCNGTTTLTLADHTAGAVNFQWQYNTGGSWVNFGPNADNTVTPPVVQTTQFRCILSCSASPDNADTAATITIEALPLPVDLGNDINVCLSKGEFVTLDAGTFPGAPNYVWNDGGNGQTRDIDETGTYIVRVTDEFTCSGTDTIEVVIRENPEVDLGKDTSICNDGTLILDAGDDGIAYSWNSGETTQTVVADNPGEYVVFVVNDEGCAISDTFNLAMAGEFPRIAGISINNNAVNTFQFTAVNPENVIAFDWDFGDGSTHSDIPNPIHTYADNKSYIVVLKLTSSCGFRSDTTSVHIVGIDQVNVGNEELTVYPNPATGTATIHNYGALKMKEIVVYNLAGQMVHRAKADSKDKHVLHLEGISSGIYTIGIFTDQGTVIRKLELLR